MAGERPAGICGHERRRTCHGVFSRDAHRRRVGGTCSTGIRDEFSTEGFGPYGRRTPLGRRTAGIHRTAPRDVLRRAGGPGRNPLAAAARRLGTGYATEAARACVAFAAKLGIPELVAFAFVGNERSRRVMQKIGMECVGEFNHLPCPRGIPCGGTPVPHPDPVKKKSAALDRPRTSRLRARAISVRSPPCREYRPKRRPHKP